MSSSCNDVRPKIKLGPEKSTPCPGIGVEFRSNFSLYDNAVHANAQQGSDCSLWSVHQLPQSDQNTLPPTFQSVSDFEYRQSVASTCLRLDLMVASENNAAGPGSSGDAAASSQVSSASWSPRRPAGSNANQNSTSLLPRSTNTANATSAQTGQSSTQPPISASSGSTTQSPQRPGAATSLGVATSSSYRVQLPLQAPTTAAARASNASQPMVPAMFGSYSGEPSSLFTFAPQGLSGRRAARQHQSYADFWRPAVRGTNSGDRSHRTQTGSTPQVPSTADPAGWAGNSPASQLTEGFQENNLLSFSWVIKDVSLLRDEVEHTPAPTAEEGRSVSAGAGRSEVWTCQPIFGDAKWKLELVRTKRDAAQASDNVEVTVLSAYLTSLVIEGGRHGGSLPTSIMLGIRVPSSHAFTESHWLWSHFDNFVFHSEAEFFECHSLPSLSELLLLSPDVARLNAFELVVQLGTGSQMGALSGTALSQRLPFRIPETSLVPDTIISALAEMIDDVQTADVALIVRERGAISTSASLPDIDGTPRHVTVWPVGTAVPCQDADSPFEAPPRVVVRDRVIWAHSSILRAGSDYFRTMLDSGFSEGQDVQGLNEHTSFRGRRVRVLRMPDADFATAHALVRYFYLSKVDLMDVEDIRSVVFDDEWTIVDEQDEVIPSWDWKDLLQMVAGDRDRAEALAERPRSFVEPTSLAARASQGSLSSSASSGLNASRAEASSKTSVSTSSAETQLSPRRSVRRSHGSAMPTGDKLLAALLEADPHPHPARSATQASSLSLYRLAHRYHLTALAALAKGHLVASLSADTAFATLLATHRYPDLHEAVCNFALVNWASVSASADFERCCDEVSAGEWGADAGAALRGFMRALASFHRTA